MNIVDIYIDIYKYVLKKEQRHITHTNNISHWICIDNKNINFSNIKIINDNKNFLNRKNTEIIIKCIKHKINIVPILYYIDDIDVLIKHSIFNSNRCVLRLIFDNYFYKNCNLIFIKYFYDNVKPDLSILKCLHKGIGLTKKDHLSVFSWRSIIFKTSNLNIIKYLHKKIGVIKQDYNSDVVIGDVCYMACYYGHVDIVKYLHKKIGFTKQDYELNNHIACYMAYMSGYINVIKYLHQEIKLTKQNFIENFTSYGIPDVPIYIGNADNNKSIKYFHEELGLTKEDFRVYIYQDRSLPQDCNIEIIEYLHREIGLKKEDFQLNDICEWACEHCFIEIIEYLHKEIGLTKKDFRFDDICQLYYENGQCFHRYKDRYVEIIKYLREKLS